MWPLLLCSLVSITIALERILFWWGERHSHEAELVEKVFSLTERGEYGQAMEVDGYSSALVRVLVKGLAERDHGLSEAMQIEAENQIDRMKQGLAVLDTIVTMAPLLGILGTVLGIIESFDLLGARGIEDPKAVTGGIAQALITTAAGLSVAIVTLIPFNYFMETVKRATGKLENTATRFEVAYRRSRGIKK
ncbi:hypothetical protein BVX94_02505 [bacterium B17]|nr:hypothetical protein BVX94_02505 [bacterium B17]